MVTAVLQLARSLPALIAASAALVGCGVDRGMLEAGVGAAASRYAALGAQVCGHATTGLAAPSVADVDASKLVEADLPGGHGRVFQVGTATATLAGFDDEGRRCEASLAFTYRAVRGSKRHPAPWQMMHLGPFVSVGSGKTRAAPRPSEPTSRKGDTSLFDRTLSPDAPSFDVRVALSARAPVTLYLHPVDDRDLSADAFALRMLLDDEPVFGAPRMGMTQQRVLVAPVTGVYTLRISSSADHPIPTRLELREGMPDAMSP